MLNSSHGRIMTKRIYFLRLCIAAYRACISYDAFGFTFRFNRHGSFVPCMIFRLNMRTLILAHSLMLLLIKTCPVPPIMALCRNGLCCNRGHYGTAFVREYLSAFRTSPIHIIPIRFAACGFSVCLYQNMRMLAHITVIYSDIPACSFQGYFYGAACSAR